MAEYIFATIPATNPCEPCNAKVGDVWVIGGEKAERIVRCRDCKHMYEHDLSAYYGNHEYDQCSCCRLLDPGAISVEPDGFCAWGERKEVDA